jgi:hypothetical protein
MERMKLCFMFYILNIEIEGMSKMIFYLFYFILF